MSFNNNLPGTPTGMPRLMRPKAVSVSPIHSTIGNVIARPVMSSQVLGTQVYQGTRISQAMPSSQPRISAQVMYPQQARVPVQQARVPVQQARVPVQLAGRVAQRPAGVHSYPTVAFQNRVAYPVQRPATGQIHQRAQVIIPGRVNSANNVPILRPAPANTANPFQVQAQHRYAVPAHLGKQVIMTQNRSIIHPQAASNVLPAGVVQRLTHINTAQIISQNEVPVRVNPNVCFSVGASGTVSNVLHPASSPVSLTASTSATVSSVTTEDTPVNLLSPSGGPPQMSSHTALATNILGENVSDVASMPNLSTEMPNVENMDVSLSGELPENKPNADKDDSSMNSMLNDTPMLVSDDGDVNGSANLDILRNQDMDSVVLIPSTETVAVSRCDDSETFSSSGNIAGNPGSSMFSGDFPPKQMVVTVSDHIVIDPLMGEHPLIGENSSIGDQPLIREDSLIDEHPLIGGQSGTDGAGSDGLNTNVASSSSLQGASNSVSTECEGNNAPCDKSCNENSVVANENLMDTDNADNESQDIGACVNNDINQSEIDDNSQDSGPGFSEKALSTCQYCSDEDSQHTGVSSDLFTEDSSNMSWEKFHEKVLNLRANKDGKKTNLEESKLSSCDGNVSSKKADKTVSDKTNEGETAVVDGDGEEEPDFIWEDYLQQIGAAAVPPTAFKHVECSLQSCFVKGMKLEVRNKSDPSTFWVATVMMTCGPLLRLRYDGYVEDNSNDFWCDFNNTELHHIGWSAQNGKNLQPPDEIKDKVSDWRTFLLESLTGARTAPSCFLEKNSGITPVDQIKCGMMLELQDILNPFQVWLVQILENVGGRLYLRLEGTQSACKHFWMFYLNPRLHPLGWASEQEECKYRPPQDIYNEQTDDKWAEILQTALKQCKDDVVPDDIFKDQAELKNHQFTVGMKLEALNPGMNQIGPATVTKVINKNYFVVEMDDLRTTEKRSSIQICCNSEYLGIFPVSWCQCKGIRLASPPGWTCTDFVWGEYLSFCNAKAAPEKLFTSGTDDHDFERGMKLEAVNPSNPNQICAATITKIVGPLLWIHLDHMRDISSHIEDIDSHNIFPVGWCESNNYLLKPPLKTKPKQKPTSECKTEEVYRSITSSRGKGAWCPKIHFNHRCFSGPYLSKGRISDLPRHVGPGPMDLVLKEVLRLLVSIAYVPCRAMKEIQQDDPPNMYMKSHLVKAKYKGKKYKVMVEVCQNESQLEEFCRSTCIKLECCPYLFSPLCVSDNCPENCQQLTKTKSNPSYVKKKKVNTLTSKPSTADLETGEPKKRGRKRKRFLFVQKKGQQGRHQETAHHDHQKDEGFIDYDDDEDGRENRRNYDIQTRGAKLPKYSFERKTHKKILMSQSNLHLDRHSIKQFKVYAPKNWNIDVKATTRRILEPREGSIKLQSNPLNWSVDEVVQYVKTTDCSHLARIMKEQEIDGQAFLLMNLSAIQEHLELKLGPAVKLCHQIERLKLAFFENYA